MRITHISDTHGQHRAAELKGGDILIHTGDFCTTHYEEEAAAFLDWLREQPYERKILVAGNHDWPLYDALGKEHEVFNFEGIDYLCNSGVEIDGEYFWGSPFQPEFFDWAFNFPRNSEALKKTWEAIPDKTTVLLTHTPPFGVLDMTFSGMRAGCELLAKKVPRLPNLKANLFGHIHEAQGLVEKRGVIFSNASFVPSFEVNEFDI
jgi:Icc-related predicted phosphoesterase